jgi:quinol monooxygenase YgiN
MAVASIMDFAGGTAADYDAVVDRMGLDGRLPPGGVFHAAGRTPEAWRVCDVWEDRAAFDGFAAERIVPFSDAQGMARPVVSTFAVRADRGGSADATAAFLQVVVLPGVDEATFTALEELIIPDEAQLPDGLVYAVDGQREDGWCVLETWSSRAARDAFVLAIGPVVDGAGVTPPTIEDMDIDRRLTAARGPAG